MTAVAPPGWGTPKRKRHPSTIPLAILLVVLVLAIIGGGIYAYVEYQYAHRDHGESPRTISSNPLCDKISGPAKERARTTNPDKAELKKYDNGSQIAWCGWRQTKGKDGEGQRFLQAELADSTTSTDDRRAEDLVERLELAKRYAGGDYQVEKLDGVGDEAYFAVKKPATTSIATVEVQVGARNANGFVKVTYSGFDVGTFSKRQPNLDELKTVATAVAQDALR
ncbi:hypothetical protein N8J89_37790 [Crossiella sp. CA-258035]|uniref:hypothetical protein n=1 Tax=Crossiella sp. CA-258035 TaxID=2981138 RepID=UPI0024BC84FD|nr:hypothetical protein [Crossiella sp. CA-258035]WHT18798.1 hypothetical protein N8J89_37790 [Crossiella sp. CA-258035]